MLRVGYKLSSEEFGPIDLVRQAVRAETAGFDFALISDHFRPWTDRVVKHFSWEPRGKWRIHKKPTKWQVRACRPWLLSELAAARPRAIVCLGATAAQALLGRGVRVTQSRDERSRRRSRPTPSPRSTRRPCCGRRTTPRAESRWSAW